MGNTNMMTVLDIKDVKANLEKINEIITMKTIMEIIGLHLEFSQDDENLCSKKVIKVKVQAFNPKLQKVDKKIKNVYLSIENFYNYFNALMNSYKYYIEEKFENRLSTLNPNELETVGLDDSDLCPICLENTVSISLPCSHFFCEKCIKGWVIKTDSCPICRFKLKYNTQNKNSIGIEGSERWSVLPNDVDVNQEFKKDCIDIFLNLTNQLFGTSLKEYK